MIYNSLNNLWFTSLYFFVFAPVKQCQLRNSCYFLSFRIIIVKFKTYFVICYLIVKKLLIYTGLSYVCCTYLIFHHLYFWCRKLWNLYANFTVNSSYWLFVLFGITPSEFISRTDFTNRVLRSDLSSSVFGIDFESERHAQGTLWSQSL